MEKFDKTTFKLEVISIVYFTINQFAHSFEVKTSIAKTIESLIACNEYFVQRFFSFNNLGKEILALR